jgi:hypothetical protein
MPIFEFGADRIHPLQPTKFADEGIWERRDIQRLLRDQIDVIAPDVFVLAEEYGEWEGSRNRIDLLALDKDANLVVIELKRTEDGGQMDLQAIRYAAMISKMTFGQAEAALAKLRGVDLESARRDILDFLGWAAPREEEFGKDVRIMLTSAEFSKELTSSVLWLNERGLDIRCVRLRPYSLEGRILVDVQQVLPLPEASDYQVQVRKKQQKEREEREGARNHDLFDLTVAGRTPRRLNKRRAILAVCKALCDGGVDPADVARTLNFPKLWFDVDGTLDSEAFVDAAEETGRQFSAVRWFFANDELVHAGGRTYALSNQWGADSWLESMENLKQAFPKFSISFSRVADSDAND